MALVTTVGSRWAAAGVLPALIVVLAGPALLLWDALRPEPWTERNLHVTFLSARYEAVSLVFTYTVENRTGRSVYLAPNATQVRALQRRQGPVVGRAFVQFPIEFPAHGLQAIEVKLDLPAGKEPMALSETPGAIRRPPPMDAPSVEAIISSSLENLDGFELVNEGKGLRLLLPRRW
jgi:hypothetical protein